MSTLSDLLLEDDREEEQGATCDLNASVEAEAASSQESKHSEKQTSSQSDSEEEQEKQRRAEHEAKEAARKAEFDERQRRKQEEKAQARQAVLAMTDAEVIAAAVKKIEDYKKDFLKDFNGDENGGVMEIEVVKPLKAGCQCDTDFARLVMNPEKSLENCFRYMGTQAYNLKKEDIQKRIQSGASYAVFAFPPNLCFQWAVNYFKDLEAAEDKEPEEKFIPHHYYPSAAKKVSQAKTTSKKNDDPQQISLF